LEYYQAGSTAYIRAAWMVDAAGLIILGGILCPPKILAV
jgi:hypothetical protein